MRNENAFKERLDVDVSEERASRITDEKNGSSDRYRSILPYEWPRSIQPTTSTKGRMKTPAGACANREIASLPALISAASVITLTAATAQNVTIAQFKPNSRRIAPCRLVLQTTPTPAASAWTTASIGTTSTTSQQSS